MEKFIIKEGNLSASSLERVIDSDFYVDEQAQASFKTKGVAVGKNYYATEYKPCDKNRNAKKQEALKNIEDIALGQKEAKNNVEKILSDAFIASKTGKLNDFVKSDNLLNNSAAPDILGGTAFLIPTIAKMFGRTFKISSELGTRASGTLYTMEDYVTCEYSENFAFTPMGAFLIERMPTFFENYDDVENEFTDLPGTQPANDNLNKYDYLVEARSIKTKSFQKSLQYNLLQQKTLETTMSIDLLAKKMEIANRYADELYYYKGIADMFKNNVYWKTEVVDKNTAGTYTNSDLVAMTGIAGADGKVAIDFESICAVDDIGAVLKFIRGFKTYAESMFGNNTMEEPVLVLPKSIFDIWTTTPLTNYKNQQKMVGFSSFKDFFENQTGIQVKPLNLLDPMFSGAGQFKNLSLSVAGAQVAFFYDKKQWLYLTTRRFTSLSQGGWNTANGVDFTQVFEGEISEVFNPYLNKEVLAQYRRIPAVKITLTNTMLTRSVSFNDTREVEKNTIKKESKKS